MCFPSGDGERESRRVISLSASPLPTLPFLRTTSARDSRDPGRVCAQRSPGTVLDVRGDEITSSTGDELGRLRPAASARARLTAATQLFQTREEEESGGGGN